MVYKAMRADETVGGKAEEKPFGAEPWGNLIFRWPGKN